jgi:hypothetical protein
MRIKPRETRKVASVIAAVGAVLAATTIASAGSAGFGGFTIRVGPEGLSPATVRLPPYSTIPSWANDDSVAHTLSFDKGRCEIVIPPGAAGSCPDFRFLLYAGTHRYQLGATGQDGQVIVALLRRTVTMVSARLSVLAGRPVTLKGTVFAQNRTPL